LIPDSIDQRNQNYQKYLHSPAFSAGQGPIAIVVIKLTAANVLTTISPSAIQSAA
jgi:hypothetical protein